MNNEQIEAARESYDNGYYAKKLEEGLLFQDVVTAELYQRGIVVIGYASRRYQREAGENMLGAEIKRDGKFRETGNLYLEIAEKSHPDNAEYIPSGIERGDNSWLYVIGDEKTIYIFSNKYLRLLKGRYKQVTTATSIGALMPINEAEKYCLRRIDIGVTNGV